jgi:probable F420-dependent oxidoreductase
MKFGIIAPYRLGPIESGEYASRFGRLVEDLGFESVWAVEHVVMCTEYSSVYPYDPSGRSPFTADTVQPDPLVWLTYVAAATNRLRLATGVLVLPQRNPVVLAKTVATLDRLSGGRLSLGIGVGWVREEAEAVGTCFADRGRRCDEYIRAMRALWCEPVASFRGDFVRFDGVVSEPRPLQPQGVPIIVGGHSKAAARRAGRLGNGFYPLGLDRERFLELKGIMHDTALEHDRDPAAIEITCPGAPSPRAADFCRSLGADRMVISPRTGDLDEMRRSLEIFRREVIEPGK